MSGSRRRLGSWRGHAFKDLAVWDPQTAFLWRDMIEAYNNSSIVSVFPLEGANRGGKSSMEVDSGPTSGTEDPNVRSLTAEITTRVRR